MKSSGSFGKGSVTTLNYAYNNTKQSKCTTEYLYDKYFNERIWILRISNCTSTTRNAYAYTELIVVYPQNRLENPTDIPVQKRA